MVYIVTLEHYICSVLATYLPPANEVWGKLMFLHLCVILFTGVHTNGVYCYVRALYLFSSSYIFTARKRSLGQANVFTPVCHSVYRGTYEWCILLR